MITDIPPGSSSSLALSETYKLNHPTVMRAEAEPTRISKPIFVYRRTVIPLEGGRVLLRLRNEPQIQVDPNTLQCEVLGWGIYIAHNAIEDVNRRMAHRFLDLFSKATSQALSFKEKADWLRLLDEVDYEAFCNDRAAPHYTEGTLLRHSPDCRVEWHDGHTEPVSLNVARALEMLEPNDRFGAFVKLGRKGEAKSLERITLISESDGT